MINPYGANLVTIAQYFQDQMTSKVKFFARFGESAGLLLIAFFRLAFFRQSEKKARCAMKQAIKIQSQT